MCSLSSTPLPSLYPSNHPSILRSLTRSLHLYLSVWVQVWDTKDLSKPLGTQELDQAAGVIMPFYDEDTKMVRAIWLAHRGSHGTVVIRAAPDPL